MERCIGRVKEPPRHPNLPIPAATSITANSPKRRVPPPSPRGRVVDNVGEA